LGTLPKRASIIGHVRINFDDRDFFAFSNTRSALLAGPISEHISSGVNSKEAAIRSIACFVGEEVCAYLAPHPAFILSGL